MKLPIFTIVRAAWRDLFRFVRQHPLALAATASCDAVLDYGMARFTLEVEPKGVAAVVPPIVAAAITMAIWLPCVFAAIRGVVSARPTPVEVFGILSPTTARYFDLCLLLKLPGLVLTPLIFVHYAFAWPMIALGAVAFFLELRITLALTALALGRSVPGPLASYRLTSGQTFRLLAILLLCLLPLGAIFLMGQLLYAEELLYLLEDPLATTLLSVVTGIVCLAMPLAGAHIFRAAITDLDGAEVPLKQ